MNFWDSPSDGSQTENSLIYPLEETKISEDQQRKINEMALHNSRKFIISGGKDRTIFISDPVKMRLIGQINITNCSNEGYRFISLRRKEEVWVCTLNGFIYIYDLNEIIGKAGK